MKCEEKIMIFFSLIFLRQNNDDMNDDEFLWKN